MLQQIHTATGKDSAAINSEILKFSYRKLYGKKLILSKKKKMLLEYKNQSYSLTRGAKVTEKNAY